jgi:carboxypeptidase family protein
MAACCERKVATLIVGSPGRKAMKFSWCVLAVTIVFISSFLLWGQETETTPPAKTGNVEGKVTNQAGAPIAGALATIRSRATQTSVTARTDASGVYSSEQVPPGTYRVEVEARDFKTVEVIAKVEASATGHADAKLEPINPGPARVGSQAKRAEVDTLPVNGRNFLDLPLLEPGVEKIDGGGLDARKTADWDLSMDGRSGRTTQIELDGLNINDETTGTTTQNVTASGINEVQVIRSQPNSSTPLGAAGAATVVTKSGTNALHGDAFYNFRDQRAGFASSPGGLDLPYQRNQFGGALGGALIKDKAFFLLSGERTKQDAQNPVAFSFPFNRLAGGYSAPYRDTGALGRLDYEVKPGMKAFYHFSYDHNTDVWSLDNYSPYFTQNNTQSHGGGLDFTHGIYMHSVRGGYSKFVNHLDPPSGIGGIFNPAPNLNLVVGQLQTGPSSFAPQTTIQRNLEGRYDGSRPAYKHGSHTVRFGGAVNRIETGGFTARGTFAPAVSGAPTLVNVRAIQSNPFAPFPALVGGDAAGAADNPLNYLVNGITIYNGLGFSSEKSAFGYAGGGHTDNRFSGYLQDTWRVRHNLNVTLGVNYVRDTGRTDSDLSPITCSQVNTTLFPTPPCTGSTLLLDQFGFITGLGIPVRQPNLNFAPQVGIAWDPGSNGKTLVRVGGGLYYDDNLFNNIMLDRRGRVAQGQFFGSANLCPTGTVVFPNGKPVSSIDGLNIATQICGRPVGNVAGAISDLQTAYKLAASALTPSPSGPNPYFLGNSLNGFNGLLAPAYQSPRVVQMNFGVQRELRRGVLSIDFVRTVGTHYLLGVDTNHVGDSRYIDVNAGVTAINNTLAANPLTSGACAPANSAGSSALTAVNCYLAHVPSASIADFAVNGLDSGTAYCGGYACSLLGKAAAFSGLNKLVGSNVMYFPVGRSRYNGLQIALRTATDQPVRHVNRMDLNLAYTFSRYKDNFSASNSGIPGDQDVLTRAQDYLSTGRYFGPSSLDRTHRFLLGPVFELPRGLQLSLIGHLESPLPVTLFLPQAGGGGVPGEIFRSDATGDGTVGDVVPGTKVGDFGRGFGTNGLKTAISVYNRVFGGQLTPAGGQLVTSLLFTTSQLVTLGAVTPNIQVPPAGNVGPQWLKTFDVRLRWPIRVREGITIEPSASAFNVFNFANFDSPQQLMSGVLDGSPGRAANNITGGCGIVVGICTGRANRIGPGSGVFSLGAPRQLEFGVRVTF